MSAPDVSWLSDEVREDIRRQVTAAPPPTDAQISVLRSIFAIAQPAEPSPGRST